MKHTLSQGFEYRNRAFTSLILAFVFVLASCRAPNGGSGNPEPVRPLPESSGEQKRTTVDASGQQAHEPIHNVMEVAPGLISGSVPEGEAGFVALAARGVKTVVSVDGATPDVESARRHGMRYVHLPIGYHGIDHARQLEIAKAIRDLPGPVYVHCHHGKHRGPAAAASAAVALEWLDPDSAVAFMKQAGTSENYAGLYRCVLELAPATAEQWDVAPTEFPEIAPVPGFVKAMSQAQDAYDHLVEIKDSGWQAPASHPDLVPSAEAGRLENLLRLMQEDPESDKYPDDFHDMLRESWHAAIELEKAINTGGTQDVRLSALNRVKNSCKACHNVYRNNK